MYTGRINKFSKINVPIIEVKIIFEPIRIEYLCLNMFSERMEEKYKILLRYYKKFS